MKKLLIAALVTALLVIGATGIVGKIVIAEPGERTCSLTLDIEETGRPQGTHSIETSSASEGSLLPTPPSGNALELACGQSLRALLRDFEDKFGDRAAQSVHPLSTLEVSGMFDEDQAFWLRQNASRYGWICLSENSLRYVGIPHAFVMRAKNFDLGQYLDYLRKTEGITVRLNGQAYVISYYPAGEPLRAPEGGSSVSGDGQNGFIVTTQCQAQSSSR